MLLWCQRCLFSFNYKMIALANKIFEKCRGALVSYLLRDQYLCCCGVRGVCFRLIINAKLVKIITTYKDHSTLMR